MQKLHNARSWKCQFNLGAEVDDTIGLGDPLTAGLGLLSSLLGGGGAGGSGGSANGATLIGPQGEGAGSINAGSVSGGAGGSGGSGGFFGLGGGGGGGGGGGAAEANAQANNANPQTMVNYQPSLNLGSSFQAALPQTFQAQPTLSGIIFPQVSSSGGYSPPGQSSPSSDPLENFASLARGGSAGSVPFLGGLPQGPAQGPPAQTQNPAADLSGQLSAGFNPQPQLAGNVSQAQPQTFPGTSIPQQPQARPNALQMAQANPQSVIAQTPTQQSFVPPPPPYSPSMLDTLGGPQAANQTAGQADQNNPMDIANVEKMESVLDGQLADLGDAGHALKLKKDGDLARLKGEVKRKHQERIEQAREGLDQAKGDLRSVRDQLFGNDTPQQRLRKMDDANNNAITALSYRNPNFIPSVQFYQQEANPKTALGTGQFWPQARIALNQMQQPQNLTGKQRLQLAARNLAVNGFRGGSLWNVTSGLAGIPVNRDIYGRAMPSGETPGAEEKALQEMAQNMYNHAFEMGKDNYNAFLKQAELNRDNSKNSAAIDPRLKAQQEFAEKEAVNAEREYKDAIKERDDDLKAQHREIISNYNADVRRLNTERAEILNRAKVQKLGADIVARGQQLGISFTNAQSMKSVAKSKAAQESRLEERESTVIAKEQAQTALSNTRAAAEAKKAGVPIGGAQAKPALTPEQAKQIWLKKHGSLPAGVK